MYFDFLFLYLIYMILKLIIKKVSKLYIIVLIFNGSHVTVRKEHNLLDI